MVTKVEREAFKQAYEHYGKDKVLSNNIVLYNAIGDLLGSDGKKLRNHLKIALDAGINQLYQQQLDFPSDDFDARVKSVLTDAGLSDEAATNIKELYDYMVGFSSDSQPNEHQPSGERSIEVSSPKSISEFASIPLIDQRDSKEKDKESQNNTKGPQNAKKIIVILLSILVLTFVAIYVHKIIDDRTKERNNEMAAAARDAKYQVGRIVSFGAYPQTKTGLDSTPIEWRVIARNGQEVLLISRNSLDFQMYNNSTTDDQWGYCSLYHWLNGTFINKAFTTYEQRGILTTKVGNTDCFGNSIPGQIDYTKDKIFLLSYIEAFKYFSNDEDRVCQPTEYAKELARNKNLFNDDSWWWWWLRTIGPDDYTVSTISKWGSIDYYSIDGYGFVRPAIWIDLDSGVF